MRFPRLAALAGLLALSCGDDQRPPLDQLPFEGIREFAEDCSRAGGDTTDFVPQPTGRNYSLAAACPNPTDRGMTTVVFQIPEPDSVWLLVYDRTNSPPIDTLFARRALAGNHRILWLRPEEGIFRVEMNTESGFRSYGDVQFMPLRSSGESPPASAR